MDHKSKSKHKISRRKHSRNSLWSRLDKDCLDNDIKVWAKESKEYSSRSWEREGNRFFSRASEGATALLIPWFQPSETSSLWHPELWKNTFLSFEGNKFVVICYNSSRKWIHPLSLNRFRSIVKAVPGYWPQRVSKEVNYGEIQKYNPGGLPFGTTPPIIAIKALSLSPK